MNPLYQLIINDIVEKAVLNRHRGEKLPRKQLKKEARNLRFDLKRGFKDIFYIFQ